MLSGGFDEIRLTGWRRAVHRIVRVPAVANVIGWFHCSVPRDPGPLGEAVGALALEAGGAARKVRYRGGQSLDRLDQDPKEAPPDLIKLRTDRLVLRRWREEDRRPFAAMNADPAVMEYFLAPLTRAESDALADRIETHLEDRGYGLWAVEIPDTAPFIGFVGLADAPADLPPAPGVEIGWRLAREHWGCGYATEAARAALHFGFSTVGLVEVVSFTSAANQRSRRVMERLGMRRDKAGDFEHPSFAPGDLFRPHALYRLSSGPETGG